MDVSTLSDDELAFVWAASMQLRLYDDHDFRWICRVRDQTFDENDWSDFLTNYRVGRGTSGSWLRKNSKAALSFLEASFRPQLKDDIQTIKVRWLNAVSGLTALSVNQANVPSATSKLMWFYWPHLMTMYDRLAVKGLENVLEESGRPIRIGSHNFIEEFFSLYSSKEALIDKVIGMLPRQYPYKRRVLDKYLWLKAADEKALSAHLTNYRRACETVPYLQG